MNERKTGEMPALNAHILLVDDDTALLQALPQALALRLKGVLVDTCDSAFIALEKVARFDYDAIVSDIKMPGMDGLALLAKVQELRPETPTLLITGHGDHNLAIQALRGGAYDFIQKPIDRDYFVAALRRAIQTRQLRRQVSEQQKTLEAHAHSLELTVQERTRELLQANLVKDEFISMASHELKTPLSSLKGMTQLLRRRLERVQSPEVTNLANMEGSIRRIEVLVNDLLNISSLEMGVFTLHRQKCEMVNFCRQVIDEYIASTNPQAVVLSEFPESPIEAEIDVERVGQVIMNLLSNARKYSPHGSPIYLRLLRSADMCSIAVQDCGVGIPAKVLPHIFERFYRVQGIEVQTGSSVGFGLGLYISEQIVLQHGGHFDVESTPGNGSTFTIFLPFSPPNAIEHTEQTLPGTTTSAG